MTGESDEALMQRYARGDMSAFETLYERYRGPLYRYFLRQSRDPTAANDLYQGCWEKVIRGRRRYRPRAPFRAWLFRVARNHFVDIQRATRPVETLDSDPPDAAGTDAAQAIDHRQERERLSAALADLPAEQRDVFLLRVEGGLGIETIGEVTGVGAETAKSRLRYAVRKLKQALET